jgi:hypothetical protein
MQAAEPSRRARQEIKRHHIRRVSRVRIQRLRNRVFGFELYIRAGKTRLDRVTVKAHYLGVDICRPERLLHPRYRAQVQLERGFGHRNLHRRRLAEHIGQRVQAADQHRDQ